MTFRALGTSAVRPVPAGVEKSSQTPCARPVAARGVVVGVVSRAHASTHLHGRADVGVVDPTAGAVALFIVRHAVREDASTRGLGDRVEECIVSGRNRSSMVGRRGTATAGVESGKGSSLA